MSLPPFYPISQQTPSSTSSPREPPLEENERKLSPREYADHLIRYIGQDDSGVVDASSLRELLVRLGFVDSYAEEVIRILNEKLGDNLDGRSLMKLMLLWMENNTNTNSVSSGTSSVSNRSPIPSPYSASPRYPIMTTPRPSSTTPPFTTPRTVTRIARSTSLPPLSFADISDLSLFDEEIVPEERKAKVSAHIKVSRHISLW